ncbi:hypothetical protein GCM10010104_10780 [Streptomyces indiaensis]|uniref:Secreted protein n=1 Tax=Streptomyces indiaensis TaxID=284033 RepID=A0ABN3UXB2_9ACTN
MPATRAVTVSVSVAAVSAVSVAAVSVPRSTVSAVTVPRSAASVVAGTLPSGGSRAVPGSVALTGPPPVLTAVLGAEARVLPVPVLGGPSRGRGLRHALPLRSARLLWLGRTLSGPADEIMALTRTVTTAVAVSGAGSAGRLGRGVGGTLRRGHRPIIARTRGALCSPRQNCR